MIGFLRRLLYRRAPVLSETSAHDAAALATLHARSFRRGWSESEFEGLMRDRAVLGHCAMAGRKLIGFIVTRVAADEAEILSVAVAAPWRGQGLAGKLLDLHMRRAAGLGVKAIFLEVDEENVAARRLYRRAGFGEVGRRQAYYHDAAGLPAAALVLRRDLA